MVGEEGSGHGSGWALKVRRERRHYHVARYEVAMRWGPTPPPGSGGVRRASRSPGPLELGPTIRGSGGGGHIEGERAVPRVREACGMAVCGADSLRPHRAGHEGGNRHRGPDNP